jgi:hypothetical protein
MLTRTPFRYFGPILTPATRKAAELIDDLVRLEAAKGFLEKENALRARRILCLTPIACAAIDPRLP